jgi:hypothetical protein
MAEKTIDECILRKDLAKGLLDVLTRETKKNYIYINSTGYHEVQRAGKSRFNQTVVGIAKQLDDLTLIKIGHGDLMSKDVILAKVYASNIENYDIEYQTIENYLSKKAREFKKNLYIEHH